MSLICPFAVYRPIDSHGGPMSHDIGLVEHITTNDFDPYGFFSNTANEASSHFWISLSGGLEQYFDLGLRSWAQAGGNDGWASCEIAGQVGTLKTPAQINTLARLFAWGHSVLGWPVQASDDPSRGGLGWHGMGGANWGGHTSCPGSQRVAQRGAVLAQVSQLVGGVAPPATAAPPPAAVRYPPFSGRLLTVGVTGTDVATWQAQMARRGWSIGIDGSYGPQSAGVCRGFQTDKHLTVDGIVGQQTWQASWSSPITP